MRVSVYVGEDKYIVSDYLHREVYETSSPYTIVSLIRDGIYQNGFLNVDVFGMVSKHGYDMKLTITMERISKKLLHTNISATYKFRNLEYVFYPIGYMHIKSINGFEIFFDRELLSNFPRLNDEIAMLINKYSHETLIFDFDDDNDYVRFWTLMEIGRLLIDYTKFGILSLIPTIDVKGEKNVPVSNYIYSFPISLQEPVFVNDLYKRIVSIVSLNYETDSGEDIVRESLEDSKTCFDFIKVLNSKLKLI